MPFGDKISETDKQSVTRMHSLQQFSATIYMFLNFETAFLFGGYSMQQHFL